MEKYSKYYNEYNARLAWHNFFEALDTIGSSSAKEFVDQIALIAKGMNVSVDEYLVELSRDSMKSMAITMLEDRWQTEFRNSNFDGTVEEFIDNCYEVLEQKYTVVIYGLE